MKFKNVKVDDIVYVEIIIKLSNNLWSGSKNFYIPKKVTRVTKTQFVVENGDRYKKDGCKIGYYYSKVYYEGDKDRYSHYGRIVCDETEKLKLFQIKLNIENQINKDLDNLECLINSDLDIDKLTKIKKVIDVLKNLFNDS